MRSKPMITIAQIKAARAMLGLKQSELAALAGVSLATLNNLERGASGPRAGTLLMIERALEKEGIRFIEPGAPCPDGGYGLRLAR